MPISTGTIGTLKLELPCASNSAAAGTPAVAAAEPEEPPISPSQRESGATGTGAAKAWLVMEKALGEFSVQASGVAPGKLVGDCSHGIVWFSSKFPSRPRRKSPSAVGLALIASRVDLRPSW